MSTSNRKSRLLNLPPEIRNMIWTLVITNYIPPPSPSTNVKPDIGAITYANTIANSRIGRSPSSSPSPSPSTTPPTNPNDIQPFRLKPTPTSLSCALWSPPPICRTTRLIRFETLPMFYHTHTFIFSINGFSPFFSILRRCLTYLRLSSPSITLHDFRLEIKGHYPVSMLDLVEYARIFGEAQTNGQVKCGLVNLQGVYERREDVVVTTSLNRTFSAADVGGEGKARRDFCEFLQDLAGLGGEVYRRHQQKHQKKEKERGKGEEEKKKRQERVPFEVYEKAIMEMLTAPGIDERHFRRFIILDCMQGLERFRERLGELWETPDWVTVARSRGKLE